jgi:hypothetical protein
MVREVSDYLPRSETCVGMQEDGALATTTMEGSPPGAPEEGLDVVLLPPVAKADLWLYLSSSGSLDDWEPCNSRSTSVDRVSDDGQSEADSKANQGSESELEELHQNPLGHIGVYSTMLNEETKSWVDKYHEQNWHAESWQLLPRQKFVGPQPGPRACLVGAVKSPVEYFLLYWNDVIQRKLVYESNSYALSWCSKTKKLKGGIGNGKPITLKEHRHFIGICALMGVRKQPHYRDYWCRSSSTLYCEEVAKTMLRERFDHLLKLIHVTNNKNFVMDKSSPDYGPIGKIKWLLENLVKNYRVHFNPGEFICVDESMIQYKGRYYGFI